MISPADLLVLKSRLLTAAEAAHQIATSADPVRYDQQSYEAVYVSLVSMKEDVGRLLAELDILRSVVHGGISMFLKEESFNEGVSVAGSDVGGVPTPPAGKGGEGEPSQPKGVDGGVQEGGVPGKRAKRSKPRRNQKRDADAPVPVGSGNGEGAMDSGPNP